MIDLQISEGRFDPKAFDRPIKFDPLLDTFSEKHKNFLHNNKKIFRLKTIGEYKDSMNKLQEIVGNVRINEIYNEIV